MVKNLPANSGDAGSIPGLGRSPPLFSHGTSQGQRSLAGDTPWGRKESDTTEATKRDSMTCYCQ